MEYWIFLYLIKGLLLNYTLDDKSLSFSSKDKKNFYNGRIDFKPFFLSMILIMKI